MKNGPSLYIGTHTILKILIWCDKSWVVLLYCSFNGSPSEISVFYRCSNPQPPLVAMETMLVNNEHVPILYVFTTLGSIPNAKIKGIWNV